ncbi:MAG: xylan 1,4-beta-xylosidase [Novosphingobium pentaromativorans]|uniref:Xylan 1,4-beta-xylosidase n=1 Tax=Novosphingobium pentaromativorans TaxID=205844 RepID=A0A2W5QHS1_9SPHN|nr:family 43 glycosylhydrolase [Novosphingobium panipatense]PZQ51070.1 MAG: xylan 1,4-beta-xylosidase [Novosphingobium pentaromativorans]
MIDRRGALHLGALASAGLAGAAGSVAPALGATTEQPPAGIEGQRRPDLGNGTYLNPVLAGDFPDPTILKDGEDYYLTHSSFEAAPGLLIWHSRDLVNWTPVGPALQNPLGIVFAVDLVKHDGRYYIYIPFMAAPWSKGLKSFANIYVIHADDIRGPWSEPVDLGIGGLIDPGHVVGEDGKRYLFLSGVNRVRLSDDGLATDGPVEKVYDGWKYPDDWITEAYSLEGPKLMRRGDWFYLITAVGGTAGPPTGHMVTVARSRSIDGPWQDCPHNPIVRTWNPADKWLSRGHASFVEGPGGDWWAVYHGYENGFHTLGRQTLLEPIRWDAEGWPRAMGGDLAKPLPSPRGGKAEAHGMAWSDDFTTPALGTRWRFYNQAPTEGARARIGDGVLELTAKGGGPNDASPLTHLTGDRAYECSVSLELQGEAQGGLLLFFNDRLFLGMGCDGERMISYRGGKASYWQEPVAKNRKIDLRIVNARNIVTMYHRVPGGEWIRHAVRSEVSGYHANTMDDLASLRPALFASGTGVARFRDYRYRALNRG